MKRIMGERAYNKNLAANNDPNRKVMVGGKFVDGKQVGGELVNAKATGAITQRKSYKLTPQEIAAHQAKQKQTVEKAEQRYNAPTNKMERWSDTNRAAGVGEIRDGRMGGSPKPSPAPRQVTIYDKVQRMNSQRDAAVRQPAKEEARTSGGSARWR